MLLGHWLIESLDAVTHAAAHAPAQLGITEALGTTDNHTSEWAGKNVKAQGRMGKVGRDYSEQYFTADFRYEYLSHLLHITIVFGVRSLNWDYVIAI